MAAKFKAGDVVRLKSGGPKMTVDTVDTVDAEETIAGYVYCKWFYGTKKYEGEFSPDALELVDVEAGGSAGVAISRSGRGILRS